MIILFQLFYRIHASILKILKHKESIDYHVLEQHLHRASMQPIYTEVLETDQAVLKELLEVDKVKENQQMEIENKPG